MFYYHNNSKQAAYSSQPLSSLKCENIFQGVRFFSVATLLSSLAISSPVMAAGRCAMEDGGTSSLRVHVPEIKPSDVANNASSAWAKIAAAVQSKYGGNVQIGLVTLTITTNQFGFTAYIPGTFPMDFKGQQSIQKAILNERGIPTSGGLDPTPCDPEKNACCDECGAQYAALDVMNIFKRGFMSHEEVIAIRQNQRRIGSGQRRLYG
jgi:hypothetical protein